ncbi:MAG: phytanoyl-CoA dioxygenase family protein [Pseudomonadales bacterium]
MRRPHALTPLEADQYARQGFFLRTGVFSPTQCELLRQAADQAACAARALARGGHSYRLDGNRFVDAGHVTIQFEHGADSELVRVIEPVQELDARLDHLLDDARIAEPMRGIIGQEDIALWTAKLNIKSPREGSGFRWHQDSPYWIHDCSHVDLLPNVMVTFDDASADNGCLRLIPGSHRKGCLPGTEDGTQLQGFFTRTDCFDESRQALMEAPAGSLIFFNPHTVHGSAPNTSDRPRRAIIITCQPGGYPTLKSKTLRPIKPGTSNPAGG